MERVGDVALDGAIRKLHLALEHAGGEAAERLGGGIGVDGGQRAGVPGVKELEQIERFPAANLSEDDAVGPMAEAGPEELADGDGGQTAVGAPGLKADQVGGAIWISAVSSITRMRSSLGMELARMLSSVVLPVPVPPEIRMFLRLRTALSRLRATSSVRVPMRTRSAIPRCGALNLRIVSVTPVRLHGGMTAATREPSGRRESRTGFSSEMSLPRRARDVLDGDHKGALVEYHSGTSSRNPRRSMKTWSGPLTMISLTSGSRIKRSICRRNGRMISKPGPRPVLRPPVAGSSSVHVQEARLQVISVGGRGLKPS